MSNLRILWPWKKVERGQGFFVPCLDPDPIRVEGLDQALNARIFNAGATVGIQGNLIGVLFYRPPVSRTVTHRQSAEQSEHSVSPDLLRELFDESPPESESP